jgi:GTP-binding protein EngB required for normal cell division
MATSVDETDQLRDYILVKQEVSEVIRTARQLFQMQGRTESAEQCQALLVKLAEDRFNLAVMGQFKRGKSSLMNAVIGRDLLPTGLLPLTSAITALCYGPQERALLRRKGWSIQQQISLDELVDYVTERGNPGNDKGLIEARVELPARFLRRGLYFIDTPGVGSARQENTATTYAFLPEVDAVIFVTSVEAPLSETEKNFLYDIRQHVRKLFVVVNKMDLLHAGERDELLRYIHTEIEQTLGESNLALYPISANQALAARLNQDSAALQASGLLEFEAALTSFLAEEQGRAFLIATLDRALSIAASEASSSTTPAAPQAPLAALLTKTESLRAMLLSGAPLPSTYNLDGPDATDMKVIERAIAASHPRQSQDNEQALLRSSTCPICERQSQAIFDFFAQWQYRLVVDGTARRAFATAHGFCAAHTWQFQQIASPQGISEGYAPLIESIVDELHHVNGRSPTQAAAHIRTLLAGAETCAACQVLRKTEAEQIERFLPYIATAEGRRLYDSAEGLCLPHLCAVLAASPNNEVAEFLIDEQARQLEEISEEMHSYILKRDALRRELWHARETSAWRRALVQIVGERLARVG